MFFSPPPPDDASLGSLSAEGSVDLYVIERVSPSRSESEIHFLLFPDRSPPPAKSKTDSLPIYHVKKRVSGTHPQKILQFRILLLSF